MTGEAPREPALETRKADELRLLSPSAARNRDPIREIFVAHMPRAGIIVEIGSGTGEHAAYIASALPDVQWLPSDPDAGSRASIDAWTHFLALRNISRARALDATQGDWTQGLPPADGVVSINMIHIAPFAAATGLIRGAGALLKPGGRLFLYGPFMRDGAHTAPSNEAFDASLKARDQAWGVRDLDREITPLAAAAGLALRAVFAMPANNFSVIFEKGAP
jgi:SAM-dependent methyltransferase